MSLRTYTKDGEYHEGTIDKTVVSLHYLHSILNAIALSELTHSILSIVSDKLNTIQSAVVHKNLSSIIILELKIKNSKNKSSYKRQDLSFL